MSRKEFTLRQSLVDYINDIKPYHTKFRDITTELAFEEQLNVNVLDKFNLGGYFQNIWTKDDHGYKLDNMVKGIDHNPLSNISEGLAIDKIFKIPDAIFPRFETVTYQQSDQAPIVANTLSVSEEIVSITGLNVTSNFHIVIDNTLGTAYGLSASALVAKIRGASYSGTINVSSLPNNLIGITLTGHSYTLTSSLDFSNIASIGYLNDVNSVLIFYTSTNRYRVPYHQGVKVKVNGVARTFNVDYTIDKSRSFIQFLPGYLPPINSEITIEYFKSDRIFISYHEPFKWDTPADKFVITIGNSDPNIEFISSEISSRKATLQDFKNISAVNGDVFEVIATGPWSFKVRQISPIVSDFTMLDFKSKYTGKISFTINREWSTYYTVDNHEYISYYITQELNSYADSNKIPSYLQDPSEFFSNLNITEDHGAIVENVNSPYVKYHIGEQIGWARRRSIDNGKFDWIFEFNQIPPKWTYIEFRIEQAAQYNPWVNAEIKDKVEIFEYLQFSDGIRFINSGSSIVIISTGFDEFPFDEKAFSLSDANAVGSFDATSFDDVVYDSSDEDSLSNLVSTSTVDDMYLTVTFQDTSAVRVRHDVSIAATMTVYTQTVPVNDLIIYRIQEAPWAPATNAKVFDLTGHLITPTSISVNDNLIRIGFNVATSFSVQIIF